MAVFIPIVSEFNSKGIEKAKKEFASLEGAGQKAQFAIKKAAIPAAAALAGVGAALVDATKGAIEDAAAQDLLANQLRKTTGATDAQIKSVEDFVSSMGSIRGVADDEVRPALAQLVRATGNVTRAQQLFKTAQDISASTGKDLTGVVMALSKAEQGQYAGLKKLGIPMGDNTRALMDQAAASNKVMKAQAAYNAALQSGDTKEATKRLEKLKEAQDALNAVTVPGADYIKDLDKAFGGAGEAAAKTAAGGFARLQISFNETKESIGAALLPAIQAVLPYLTKFGEWAAKNPNLILAVGAAIATIAAAIVAVNVAMALNPFSLIIIGVVAVGAALVAAYKKFEGFRNIVDAVFGAMRFWINNVTIPLVQNLLTIFKSVFNGIASAWNNTIGKLSFKFPSFVPGLGGKGFDVPNIPMLAEGGIVPYRPGGTLAIVGEAGPEAVIPLSKMGSMGGNNVTINVNGGDPNAVVDALRRYMQLNGSVPIRVSS